MFGSLFRSGGVVDANNDALVKVGVVSGVRVPIWRTGILGRGAIEIMR